MAPWCQWYHGTMVQRYHGVMVPWRHGAKVPWCSGTMVPWHHGTMVPWHHGTMAPWYASSISRQPTVMNHEASIVKHQTSMINQLSSVINDQLLGINHESSINNHQPAWYQIMAQMLFGRFWLQNKDLSPSVGAIGSIFRAGSVPMGPGGWGVRQGCAPLETQGEGLRPPPPRRPATETSGIVPHLCTFCTSVYLEPP